MFDSSELLVETKSSGRYNIFSKRSVFSNLATSASFHASLTCMHISRLRVCSVYDDVVERVFCVLPAYTRECVHSWSRDEALYSRARRWQLYYWKS